MKGSLLEIARRDGIWRDATIDGAGRVIGKGEPWFPPPDTVAIDCRQVYRACWVSSAGEAVTKSMVDTATGGWIGEDYYHPTPVPPKSHALDMLAMFDDGPAEFAPPLTLPFPCTWLELGAGLGDKESVGVFLWRADDGETIMAWHVAMVHGLIAVPLAMAAMSIERHDVPPFCWANPAGEVVYSMAPERMYPTAQGDTAGPTIVHDLRVIPAVHLALRLPNTRIAEIAEARTDRPGRKQKRLRPHQRIQWREIVMAGVQQRSTRRQAARGNAPIMAEHLVRENYALYTDDAPMFGKPGMVGWFRRPAHRRGSSANGVVVQRRRIEIP